MQYEEQLSGGYGRLIPGGMNMGEPVAGSIITKWIEGLLGQLDPP